VITGDENFLHRTLSSVGVPPLHILRAQNGLEYRFYELTGDLPEALHFRHFERNGAETLHIGERIRLKNEVHLLDAPTVTINSASPAHGRIRIKEESPKKPAPVKPAAEKTSEAVPRTSEAVPRTSEAVPRIKLKQTKKGTVKTTKISEPTSMRIRYTSMGRSLRIISKLGRGHIKVCKI